jgi:flagellar assembly factor FliW
MTQIQTTRFGTLEINEEHLVEFRDGMIGFNACKRYVVVESLATPHILWLQSLDAPEIAFPLMEPQFFKKDYKAPLNDADKASLNFLDGDKLKVFCVLTIPTNSEQMTVNMKAPLVINVDRATAAQVILQDKSLELRAPAYEVFQNTWSAFTVQEQRAPQVVEENSWSPVALRAQVRDASL